MTKKKAKTSKKEPTNKAVEFAKKHKLVLILASLLLIPVLLYANNQYKDWDNSEIIKGLSEDFPQLVEEIEQSTGLELQINADCSTTQEKFSSGVRTCELLVAKRSEQETIEKAIEAVRSSKIPSNSKISQTGRTVKVQYKNKNSCQISRQETVYLSCIIAVRDANIDLARDTFLPLDETN